VYRWIVFLHVLSAFGFFLAHGMATTMAFRLRRERALERIRALLDASGSAIPVLLLTLLVVLLSGVALGFLGNWWRTGWIWVSLGLLVALFVWMSWYSGRYYVPIRRAAGLPYRDGNREHPAGEAQSEDEIERLVRRTSPWTLLVGGMGGWAVIVYLMMFKPF
jgi:hypothetical protein